MHLIFTNAVALQSRIIQQEKISSKHLDTKHGRLWPILAKLFPIKCNKYKNIERKKGGGKAKDEMRYLKAIKED